MKRELFTLLAVTIGFIIGAFFGRSVVLADKAEPPSDAALVYDAKSDSGKIEVLHERIIELEEKVEWLMEPHQDDYEIDKEIEAEYGVAR